MSRAGLVSDGHARLTGAVVVGGDFQGLGIIRSLGRRGVPVCVIDDELSIGRFSRYATHGVRVPDLRDEARTVETVLDIGQRLGLDGWLLYPTREELVAAFSHHRTRLEEHFRVSTPSWSTTQWAWDKRNTYRLARELGIPIPRTWYARNVRDLDQIDGQPPFAVKPAIKEHFIYGTKAKAWRAGSREELVARFRQAAELIGPEEVMIQELIPGDGRQHFAYCAFFKEGRAVASMEVRRRRQHPLEFGRASTFVETVDLPLLKSLSEQFLRAIDYYGLVEVEYKLDPRTGEYKLLDVNARTWGYHSLGWAAGIDFPYLLFADQVGEPVEPSRARLGVKWLRLTTDLPTAIQSIARGHLSWKDYARTVLGTDTEAVFSREDPIPGLVELALIPYLYMKRGF